MPRKLFASSLPPLGWLILCISSAMLALIVFAVIGVAMMG